MKKISLKPLRSYNPFFPTPDEFAEFMGANVSARNKVKTLAPLMGIKITITDRSLDNLGKTGISLKTASTLIDNVLTFLRRINLNFPNLFKLRRLMAADVGIYWEQAIKGYRCSQDRSGNELDLNLAYIGNFIATRQCDIQPQLDILRKHKGTKSPPDFELLVEFYSPVLPKTCLTTKEQETVLNIFKYGLHHGKLVPEHEAALALFINDFNLSLLATVDHTLIDYYERYLQEQGICVSSASKWPSTGIIYDVFSQEGMTYFDRFISYLKWLSGKSYAELAEAVPVTRSGKQKGEEDLDANDSGRLLLDIQKETLKDWRRGKTRPSIEKLNGFFDELKLLNTFDLTLYGVIFVGIDKYIAKVVKTNQSNTQMKETLEQVFNEEHYKRHYDKWKKLPE
ncbi:hypothetical protein L1D54_18660 [Vibrio brasiliensis]|uniref:hypothetical protein n=1 Tax=Vibrio brasiliensis TaxID=170652 RepID=UPI001EFD0D8A|nr:hypothetical protein [Vibrio brasiliensis]MCG9752500.1 hypothetical protein [Vibrio brasiliensis]